MNQQPRLHQHRDSLVYRCRCSPRPTVPRVHLERGLSLLSPQAASAPAPGSTLNSLSTAMMFDSGPAGHHPGAGAAGAGIRSSRRLRRSMIIDDQPRTPVPFSGGRKRTPRSVRIVSMQDANAASATTPTGAGNGGRAGAGVGGRRERGTEDDDAGKQ